ncbi:mRNA 3'-end-processing protein rna14, partial [Kappamyces sp. JEL0680]
MTETENKSKTKAATGNSAENGGEWVSTTATALEARVAQLEAAVAKNEFDYESRDLLVAQLALTGDKDRIRKGFSERCARFPTCTRYWIAWIDWEKEHIKDYDEIERIFKECIRDTPTVELYTEYLDYIYHVHSPDRAPGPEEKQKAQQTIISTFDYVLNAVGTDKDSGDLWMRFIKFVRKQEVTSSYEEQQKMDQLRRIFHKAVHTPIHNIEEIWKEYDTFEHNLSKLTAKKFIADQAAGYMTARGATKDLHSLLGPIDQIGAKWVAKPPVWSNAEVQLLNYWKRYLSWERSNPLHFEERAPLLARVLHAYQSALLHLRYFPEMWYDAAMYLYECDLKDDAIALLKKGIVANPSSLLLSFTAAELLESTKSGDAGFEQVTAIFDGLIKALEDLYAATNQKFDAQRSAMLDFLRQNSVLDEVADEDEGERRERERELTKEHDREVQVRVESVRERELGSLKQSLTLVWIVYMRLSRRSQSIRAARLIFSKARKSSLVTSHLFTASALMEYYVNKDAIVAGKIFEVGLKSFPLNEDPQAAFYVEHYLDFLMCLNDDNNTRALFERALAAIPPEKSKPIWEKYIEYETQYGDLTNLYGIEKRVNEVFPAEDCNSIESLQKLASKWKYFDLQVVGNRELGIHVLSQHPRIPAPAVLNPLRPKSMLGSGEKRQDDKNRMQPLLGGINAERFPRPELGRWYLYKPEPGQ